jgi:hypothetical protein
MSPVTGARIAASAALASLVVAGTAWADHPESRYEAEAGALGRAHAAEHALLRAQERRVHRRFRRASPARVEALRERERRGRRTAIRESARSEAQFPPQQFGSWTTPGGRPFRLEGASYAIHAAMLPTGKVLFWGYPDDPGDGKPNTGEAALWDPAAPDPTSPAAFTAVPPLFDIDGDGAAEPVPIYCSGQSFLPSGELLLTGGNLVFPADEPDDAYDDYAGIRTVISFDPFTESWTRHPDLRQGRWYPSQVALPDGRQLIAGGYNQRPPGGLYNRDVELFEPGGAPGLAGTVRRLRAASRETQNYPHLFTLPDGRVLLAGPGRGDSATLSRKFEWTNLRKPVQDRIGGTAALLPAGSGGSSRVVQIGGHPAGRVPATSAETAEVIDAAAKRPRWRPFAPLNLNRSNHNTVLLPDGSMVTVGGGTGIDSEAGNYRVEGTERRHVELWDPASATWRLGPPQVEERTYHSVALLLPDGRVWSAGDDKHPTQVFGDGTVGFSSDDTGEIYSPPYLFADDGQPLAPDERPQILAAPAGISYDGRFTVATGGPEAASAVLVAPSATTHAADMTQRVVPLRAAGAAGGLELTAPPSGRVAPPGWYMLFVLDATGTPSVATWVQLN